MATTNRQENKGNGTTNPHERGRSKKLKVVNCNGGSTTTTRTCEGEDSHRGLKPHEEENENKMMLEVLLSSQPLVRGRDEDSAVVDHSVHTNLETPEREEQEV